MLLCKFCSKECKNDNSLRNHERLCKSNENRQTTYFQTNREDMQHGNQYTKALRLGLPKPIVTEVTRKKLSDRNLLRSDEFNKENGKRISKTVTEKVANGTWHTSLAKHMHIDYNGIDLHGSWEVAYAKYLDCNNVKWIRNKDSFSYNFEDKNRRYTPDFYLIDDDVYVEIKGYETEKDRAKWEQFPPHRKLLILKKDELKALGII